MKRDPASVSFCLQNNTMRFHPKQIEKETRLLLEADESWQHSSISHTFPLPP